MKRRAALRPSAIVALGFSSLLASSLAWSAPKDAHESLNKLGTSFGTSSSPPAPASPRAAQRGTQASAPPLVILVHGVKPVATNFDPLEAEMRRRGCLVFRFDYDSTQSLETSADQFIAAARDLWKQAGPRRLVVLAHSMGGLVARRAMIEGRAATLAGEFPIELITIASPFGGYANADNIALPWNVFGITESYRSLGTSAAFIRHPGRLGPNVSHVKIETERDTAARPQNQRNDAVDSDPRLVRRLGVALGHVDVLGDGGGVPAELSRLLDERIPRSR